MQRKKKNNGIETVIYNKDEMTLKEAKAKKVWDNFRQINCIPRCSKNEQKIIEWLKGFAKTNNLTCRTDSVGNTLIEIPATKGYEKSQAVILQSHVDMVCEKTPESKHDFTKDPIELVERDGWICANGTTLGADNGAGVAIALAIAKEKTLKHPRLELLFTVDEETGLTGAIGLEQGFMTGKYLINLDGEDESFIVGCAGGEQTKIQMLLQYVAVSKSFECYTLKVSGLHGGHSGIDIDKQRANAINLLARILYQLNNRFDFGISFIEGGSAHNAIPRDSMAKVCFDPRNYEQIKKNIGDFASLLKEEFSKTEPNLKIELIGQKSQPIEQVWPHQFAEKVIDLLSAMPCGVYRMSNEFNQTVETSSNLARIETLTDSNLLRILTSQRSFETSSLEDLTSKITAIANLAGVEINTSARYPSWKPDINSSLLKRAKEVYKKLNKNEPEVKVVHAGLETAVIGEKFSNIEMISIGPTIQNPHSPQERVNIASIDKAWHFLNEFLPVLK